MVSLEAPETQYTSVANDVRQAVLEMVRASWQSDRKLPEHRLGDGVGIEPGHGLEDDPARGGGVEPRDLDKVPRVANL
jgi:hypothetical protein